MPTYQDFRLPDLGEGLTEGEILSWLVAEGDQVTLNQPLVEVETAKAAVEIPSPYAGVVRTLHHAAGETVDVGSPIITFDTDPDGEIPTTQGGDLVPREPGIVGSPAPKAETEEKISVLVGTGPKAGKLTRRARKAAAAEEAPVEPAPERPEPVRLSAAAVAANAQHVVTDTDTAEVHVLAKPPVRKLARDLGVDLRRVRGTGPNGTVSRGDVESAASGSAASPPGVSAGAGDQRIPVKGVRKATAAAMVASAFTAPHVTEFVTVDVTPTMELVARLRELPGLRGGEGLAAAGGGASIAARGTPAPDAQLVVGRPGAGDRRPQRRQPRDRCSHPAWPDRPQHQGRRGVDTAGPGPGAGGADDDRAQRQDLPGRHAARTITITNVGVFGVDNGTPILNPGEAAILCFGAVRDMPWVHQGRAGDPQGHPAIALVRPPHRRRPARQPVPVGSGRVAR